MSITSYINDMPRQKLPVSKKNEDWRKSCIDAGLKLVNISDTTRRGLRKNKIRNYNLYNGVFDKNDMERELQPISSEDFSFPAVPQYRDIISPIFNVLFGEQLKRGTQFIVRGTGDDVHSSKENIKRQIVLQMLDSQLSQNNEDTAFKEPADIEKYFNYSYEDIQESVSSKVLHYLFRKLELEREFSVAWEDVILVAEEIFSVDLVSNEPVAKRENPLEIYFLLAPNSFIIDEADLIVRETYMPVGRVIDEFYEELTPAQIDHLEEIGNNAPAFTDGMFRLPDKQYIGTEDNAANMQHNSGYLDGEGNVRVCKVIWKSRKKIGFRQFIDENGMQQEDVVSEEYKADKENTNESIKWSWINEYWEGTKIYDDIYVKMYPRKFQFRRMDNISACKSGFIGSVYNANNSRSISLMDRLVPWVYLYITLWYRYELLMATNYGKIALIDVSLIPDGWKVEKWLYYASIMKFGFVNSFNEGKKGQSTGKLAGNISTQNKSLDLDTGNSIQGHINLLEYVEKKIEEVSGVSPQRKGIIQEREAVRNVQSTVLLSSNVTEKYFQIHSWTKERVLNSLMEVAKYAWRNGSRNLQYVTDDMATIFFAVNGDDFVNTENGVFVSNASRDMEVLNYMRQHIEVAMQYDRISFSDAIDMYMNNSLADIKNKIKQSENERKKAAEESQAQAVQATMQDKEADRILKREEISSQEATAQADRQNNIDVALIQAGSKAQATDVNRNNMPDIMESQFKEKIAIEKEKIKNKKETDDKKIRLAEKAQNLKSPAAK